MKNKFTKFEKIYRNLSKNFDEIFWKNKSYPQKRAFCGLFLVHIWELWTFFNPHIESVDIF